VPFGIIAVLGIAVLMPRRKKRTQTSFDWLGFSFLSLGIIGLQLMLDRGQQKDWFSSSEIIMAAVFAGLGFYLFIVHLLTTRRPPFLRPALFRDLNFTVAMATMFVMGAVILASSALIAPYLQDMGNYPVVTAGLVMAPRGFGTMTAMLLAGWLTARVDPRKLMVFGVIMVDYSLYRMVTWLPDVSQLEVITTIVLQGFGLGFVFTPLQVAGFATLRPDLRGEGTGMLNLCRNIGMAVGTSITATLLARNEQVVHSGLAGFITPFKHGLQPGGRFRLYLDPFTHAGAALLNKMINYQAAVIAYSDDFRFLLLASLPMILLFLVMHRPRAAVSQTEVME
jgi:DHA2 family multidrug resistance protein